MANSLQQFSGNVSPIGFIPIVQIRLNDSMQASALHRQLLGAKLRVLFCVSGQADSTNFTNLCERVAHFALPLLVPSQLSHLSYCGFCPHIHHFVTASSSSAPASNFSQYTSMQLIESSKEKHLAFLRESWHCFRQITNRTTPLPPVNSENLVWVFAIQICHAAYQVLILASSQEIDLWCRAIWYDIETEVLHLNASESMWGADLSTTLHKS